MGVNLRKVVNMIAVEGQQFVEQILAHLPADPDVMALGIVAPQQLIKHLAGNDVKVLVAGRFAASEQAFLQIKVWRFL